MELYKSIRTSSVEKTEDEGRELARALLADESLPRFVALEGDLGVGKTAFVRGFVSYISPTSLVRSPTFALVNEYGKRGEQKVFHFDVYRITDEEDLYSTGFYDYLDGHSICLVEWSENIRYAFPDEYFTVRIEKDDADNADSRLISVEVKKK